MRFLSNILVKAGLVVEGATSVATVSGGFIVGSTVDAGFKADIHGTLKVRNILHIGSGQADAGVLKLPTNDGSFIVGGNQLSIASIPVRNIIISTAATYSSLTGGSNVLLGRVAGSTLTSGSSNVFVGKGAGNGITTGLANIILSSSDASNLPLSLSNSIHLVAGGGYRLNDASTVPTTPHVFIGGGYGSSTALKDFYFGQLPFTPDGGIAQTNITFHAPSGFGTDVNGSSFTIAAGRGTGNGTPGDVYISTSTATTSGTTVQVLTNRIRVSGGTGQVTLYNLAGTGSRFVVADSSGVLSAQATSATISADLASDYDNNITGSRNSVNTLFTLSQNFVAGSTRVFVNGIRYTRGASYDYVETGTNQITFTNAPDLGDLIVVDYVKA